MSWGCHKYPWAGSRESYEPVCVEYVRTEAAGRSESGNNHAPYTGPRDVYHDDHPDREPSIMSQKITREALESYLNCRVKGALELLGEHGTRSEYGRLLDESKQELRRAAVDLVKARCPSAHDAGGTMVSRQLLIRGPALVLDATLENDLLSLRVDGLKRVAGTSDLGDFHYIPILFGEGGKARQSQKRTLEICGLVVGEIQGRQPSKGILVNSEESSFDGVRLQADTRATRTLLRALREMRDASAAPEPVLNNHCPVCRFQQRCRARASVTDHLSLLRGMGEKEIAKLGRRGIFSVTQLSYTYRPRRTGKDRRSIRGHSFALQALALREKKIYVLGNPELPDGPVRIYFDIEGSADRGTAYLIGMIVEEGGAERRFSFWADGDGQEERILGGFLDIVEGYRDSRLFCYGSFEVAFLKRMRRPGLAERIDPILARTTNILPLIYSSVYFPVYSNGLKEIGAHLGCQWTAPDASGLQCVVWRRRWEQSRNAELRCTIETYNLEDCTALRKVVWFLHGVGAGGTPGPRSDAESMPDFSRAEQCPVPSSRREWCKASFAIPDFDKRALNNNFSRSRNAVSESAVSQGFARCYSEQCAEVIV
jgi:predicted RecB family nuclease